MYVHRIISIIRIYDIYILKEVNLRSYYAYLL